ncbi:MAG: hypothetical protein ACR2KZ_16075 [Segetibacter sp.]
MNEFTPSPESEPIVSEVLQKALNDGWILEEDREFLGDDLPDILGNLYGTILEQGGDPDEVFAGWGVTLEESGQAE